MPKCQGKRRKFRGHRYGTFACGRNATAVIQMNVGLSTRHNVCDNAECYASITHGYPAAVVMDLKARKR